MFWARRWGAGETCHFEIELIDRREGIGIDAVAVRRNALAWPEKAEPAGRAAQSCDRLRETAMGMDLQIEEDACLSLAQPVCQPQRWDNAKAARLQHKNLIDQAQAFDQRRVGSCRDINNPVQPCEPVAQRLEKGSCREHTAETTPFQHADRRQGVSPNGEAILNGTQSQRLPIRGLHTDMPKKLLMKSIKSQNQKIFERFL